MLTREKFLSFHIRRGIMGYLQYPSQATKLTIKTTPRTSMANTYGVLQPCGASLAILRQSAKLLTQSHL